MSSGTVISFQHFLILLVSVVFLFVLLNTQSLSFTNTLLSARRTILYISSPRIPIKPHNRWIVVTTIHSPTEDIKSLASSGWNLVVVADRNTPLDWFLDGVHFLSIEDQRVLGLSLPNLLPYGTYTRKNIGYIYAIQRGAEWIYDTDDDNKPYGLGLEQFTYETVTSGLRWQSLSNASTSDNVFNPYSYYGNSHMWPRGFPLEFISNHSNGVDRMVLCRKMRTAVVQQGLVHKDPDVDAIYRLLHATGKTGLDEQFDRNAGPVVLDIGTFAPWNSQNTLFHRRAFFTLFLPTSVEFRVTDIWRSYFSQKLLHLIGESIAFYPVNALQIRNAHNYLEDFNDERSVYLKSGKIIAFLEKWTCSVNVTEECTIELAERFRDEQFWGKQDVDLIRAWITDLRSIAYEFPPIALPSNYIASDSKDSNCHRVHVDFSLARIRKSNNSRVENFENIIEFCDKFGDSGNMTLPLATAIIDNQTKNEALVEKSRTALILTANWPWQYGIGVLQRLYEPYFAVTVLCGTWDEKLYMKQETLPKIQKPFNYIHLSQEQIRGGFFEYLCLAKSRDLKLQNVDGYYLVADDSIFNLWNSSPQNVSVIPEGHFYNRNSIWWDGPFGKNATERVMNLTTEKYADNYEVQTLWKEFNKRVKLNGYNKTGDDIFTTFTGRSMSDFLYFPSYDVEFVADMFELFSEGTLFSETSTAKIIHALNFSTCDSFNYLWGEERNHYETSYNSSLLFLHPIKIGPVDYNRNETKKFCETVVKTFKENMYS